MSKVDLFSENKDYKVYLDKFVSLPHLPAADGCTDKNPRPTRVAPKMSHTGIKTKFGPQAQRPVYSSGNLTNEYIANTYLKGRSTARAIMKAELALVRTQFEKSTYLEERLMELEERRHVHGEVCNQQLDEEKSFMKSMSSTDMSKSGKKKKNKLNLPGTAQRPHKVFNEETLVRCILDTTEMSMCSTKSNRDDDGSISTTSTMRRKKVNTAKWDEEALKLAHGDEDDMYSLSESV
jgi:hypothetical protein